MPTEEQLTFPFYNADPAEDTARINFLEDHGATWHIPFIADGPFSFTRSQIDQLRHRLDE